MRNRIGNVLWGLLLVLIGLGFAGNAFDLWSFELFFDGWWTLFIIIPCAISVFQNGLQLWNIVGLIIGGLLLASAQNIFNAAIIGQLIFPVIIIAIGLSIIFKGKFGSRRKLLTSINHEGVKDYSAIFGSQELRFPGDVFDGANLTAIFGSVELDLRQAIINEDVYIEATAIFGGINIMLPPDVRVETSSTPIFGGLTNKAIMPLNENPKTIYINSTTIFGGTEIK